MKTDNPVKTLVRSIISTVEKYINRAVTMGDMYMYVQKELEAGIIDHYGNRIPGTLYGWIVDMYQEASGPFALITKEDGKLYKVPVFVDENSQISTGPWQEVVKDFTPVSRAKPMEDGSVSYSFSVKRMADGSIRWIAGPACTAVLNRVGEIDSRKLFDSFIEFKDRNNYYPKLDFFHLGDDLLLGEADYIARDDVSYIASGTFYDTPIGRAAAKSLEEHPEYWGTSISYLATEEPEILRNSEGVEIPVFNSGINRYVSICPEDLAASILTSITTVKGVDRMNETVRNNLLKLAGGDTALVDALEKNIDGVNRSAEGMINRTNEPAAAVTPPVVETPAAQSPAPVERAPLTDAEMLQIMAHPKFKERLTEVLTEVLEEEDPNKPATPQTPAPVTTNAPAGDQPAAPNDVVMQALEEIREELRTIREGEEKTGSLQEVLDNLPSRVSRQAIVRPRATNMPGAVRNRSKGIISLADIAEQTLADNNMSE